MLKIQKEVKKIFSIFGRTPLQERLNDVFNEAIELKRFTDNANLKEETGDCLASLMQLCNEQDWDVEEVVRNTLSKIEKRRQQYSTLGRKKVIAILGGAFNPPTLGHLEVAQYVLNTSRTFDEVWITPCMAHMYNKQLVSSEHRLAMCQELVKNDARIKVFDYEIKNQLKGETYHFVKRLLEEPFAKNEYDFSLIIGLDNALTFDKWVNYELLKNMIRFVIVPRTGYNFDPKINWFLTPPHIFLGSPDKPLSDISSTMVRDKIQKVGNYPSVVELIGHDVFQYIQKNKLYNIE